MEVVSINSRRKEQIQEEEQKKVKVLESYNKKTEFSMGKDKIGIIKLFNFNINYALSQSVQDKEATLYKNNIISFLDKNSNMTGLILDFRNHGGGNMYPLIFAFTRFLNNSSLFAWDNERVSKPEKKWMNLVDGKAKFDQQFIPAAGSESQMPVAVIIGKKTGSTGEFVASAFMARDNVKLFGERSGGYLSVNNTYFFDKFIFITPESLQTSRNLQFKEFIEPNVVTQQPITAAKQFILSKNE